MAFKFKLYKNTNIGNSELCITRKLDYVYLQGITGSQAKIVSVASGFDALDDTATATTVLNTMCGTAADSKGQFTTENF